MGRIWTCSEIEGLHSIFITTVHNFCPSPIFQTGLGMGLHCTELNWKNTTHLLTSALLLVLCTVTVQPTTNL